MSAPASSPRAELEAAYARHRACQVRGDWEGLAGCFAPDARYHDPIHGSFAGREAIRRFLVDVMRNGGAWEFAELWRVAEGDRLVFGWRQRFTEPRPDGTPYEFGGVTVLLLGPGALWSEQTDVYDTAHARAVLHEWAISRKHAASETGAEAGP